MYGTWNRLNAVAQSTKAMSTQTPAGTGPSDAGTAKVSAKKTGSRSAPSSMNRRRDPVTARL